MTDRIEAPEWQPMDTAPRNGTSVLGIDAKGRTRKIWWFAPSSRTQNWFNCETQAKFYPVGWIPWPEFEHDLDPRTPKYGVAP
jgi:hypothetical protein